MPRNKTAVQDLGTICAHGTEFRAHIQFRGDAGKALPDLQIRGHQFFDIGPRAQGFYTKALSTLAS